MADDSFPDAHQQVERFVYAPPAWEQIRLIVATLGLIVDALRFERSLMGMRPSSFTLRELLEVAADQYRMHVKLAQTMTAPKMRGGLTAARERANRALADCAAIVRSGCLWKVNLEGIHDPSLHVWMEETALPGLSKIAAHLMKQLEVLGPRHPSETSRNAAKPGRDEYYMVILGIWNEFTADPKMKGRLRTPFFQAVTGPVLGINVATTAAINSWLQRHGTS